ncbi:MAG TPA: ankyrin repeat domain-containing protein [Chthonomonadaceae bacterium]|nr:ankyrin repeat domain-containing protein [Chthonomonadaceae bacterium]
MIARVHWQERLDRALIAAVKRRDTRAVAALVDSGANPNTVDWPSGNVSLLDTVSDMVHGDSGRTSKRCSSALMLAAGCRSDAIDYRTAGCAEPDNYALVRLLVDRGAHVNCTNQFGSTPLLEAVYGHRTKAAILLIERGADVKTKSEFLPFCSGIWQNGSGFVRPTPELLRTEVAHGADVNAPIDTSPGSDLGEVCTPIVAIMENHSDSGTVVDNLCTLLDAGADPNHVSTRDTTPLMRAAELAGPNVGQLLLSHGARVNQITKRNGTALHYARTLLRYAPTPQRTAEIKMYITLLKRNGAVDRCLP